MIYTPKTLDYINDYDRFDLPFLRKEKGGKIYNGKFEVTDTSEKLKGVFSKTDTVKLSDYLVYRPLPIELLQWQNPPHVQQDSADMENFYADIIYHSVHGVWIHGEYFNPLFVYWLNIFVFPVYKMNPDGTPSEDFDTSHPYYCNIDRYIFDNIWKAMLSRKDSSLMGGRGVGKSFIFGSIIDRNYRLFPKSWTVVSSSNEDMTNEAWKKVDECITSIEQLHTTIKHKRRLGGDSANLIESGEDIELPDRTKTVRGYLSKIEKIVYGKSPGKTRGKRPNIQHIEEFAAFPPSHQKGNLKSCMRESRGSWYVGGSIKKCTVLYSGTGGSVENDEAEGVFLNPIAHEILPTYDWEKPCGIFIPTHIKRSGTWETTGCPNVAQAEKEVDKEREEAKSDPVKYMGLLQEYPKTLKEVFMRTGSNIFNQNKISEQRTRIEFDDPNIIKPERGFLQWRKDEVTHRILGVKWEPSNMGDIEIIEHPFWVRATSDSDKKVIDNLYVAGCDSIDQGRGDSMYSAGSNKGSELGILVKKRILDNNYFKETSNLYVAKYVGRSEDVRDDHDNALKLSVYYNAMVNIEFTKIGIVGHFRDKGYYNMLMKRPSIARGDADPLKASNLIGTQASTPVIDHMDSKVKEYIDDHYDKIYFKDLLEQCQNYLRENRTEFDLVIAMGLAELADEDKMGEIAKKEERETEQLQLFGYYTDPVTGYKKQGIIPNNKSTDSSNSMIQREAEAFNRAGGVRWIDMSDPENPKLHF
jgi:hypothetical protein